MALECYSQKSVSGGYFDGISYIYVFKRDGEIVGIEDSQWLGPSEDHVTEYCQYRTNCDGMVVITTDYIEFRPSFAEHKTASVIFYKDNTHSFIMRKDAKAPRPIFPEMINLEPCGGVMSYKPELFPALSLPCVNSHNDYKGREIVTEDGELVNYEMLINLLRG